MIIFTALVALAFAAFSGNSHAAIGPEPPAARTAVTGGDAVAVGASRWVRVSATHRLNVRFHGVRITGARGSFRGWGYIVLRRVKVTDGAPQLMRAADLGVDVRFVHTRLKKPLTLRWHLRSAPRGFTPVIVHQDRQGNWRVQAARRVGHRTFVLRTRKFSINLPGFLAQFISDVKQWGKDLGSWVASGVAGRTPALTCGDSAPGWFSYNKRSDLVHTCSITNDGRAEIQLKSNRGITEDIRVPGNPDYIWVEDQPAPLRGLLTKVGFDANHEVLLPAGARMTVGYSRPAADESGSFVIADDTGPAFLDDMLRAAVDKVFGAVLDKHHQGLLLIYTEAQCAANLHLSVSDGLLDPAKNAGQMLGCMIQQLPSQLDNPAALQAIGLDSLDVDALTAATRSVKAVAKAIDWYPFFQATAFHDIDDSLRSLLKDGNDHVDISLTAAPKTTPTPGPTPTLPSSPVGTTPTTPTAPPSASATHVNIYDNYGGGAAGHAMCRGNPGNGLSMPGGTATQTFTAPAGIASIDHALVQIDPDSRVNAHAVLSVNGGARASADAAAAGDTNFAFPAVGVTPGDQVALSISFTASYGKIITVYTVGAPGGTFTAQNSCPDGAPSISTSSTGLRAVISGWTG